MWELDYKEGWAPKNWCFWTVVLEKTLESPLESKEIQPVHPKGNQSWIFIGRTDAEAETHILGPPDANNWLIGKDPDAGKDWRWEEKQMTEDEMVGWHHQFDGYEFEWTPGVSDGQGGLVCCSPWCYKELDTTERLNWTELSSTELSFSGSSRVFSPLLSILLFKFFHLKSFLLKYRGYTTKSVRQWFTILKVYTPFMGPFPMAQWIKKPPPMH